MAKTDKSTKSSTKKQDTVAGTPKNKKASTIDSQTGGDRTFMFIILGILVIGLVGLAYFVTSRETVPTGEAVAPVEYEGDPLATTTGQPVTLDATQDPAIGESLPMMSGTDFSGKEVTIDPNDGRAKAVYFLAHWCQHCQVEVPKIVDMANKGLVPDDLDIYAVSTGFDPALGNPPGRWFYNEKWPFPIIRDDADTSLLKLAGGGGFPYAIYVNTDGKVVARSSGEIDEATISSLWDVAVSGGAELSSPPAEEEEE